MTGKRIPLPAPVAKIYEAVAELEAAYPGRKFTPDGHLVGSIDEAIAAEALKLTPCGSSHPGHDAYDVNGDVQMKATGLTGRSVAMYATSVRLVVLKIVSPHEADIVYDGPGEPAWTKQACVGRPTLRLLRFLFWRRFLSEERVTLFRNLLRAGAMGKDGQCVVSLASLRKISAAQSSN